MVNHAPKTTPAVLSHLQQRLRLFEVIPAVATHKHNLTAAAHNPARVPRQRYHALLLLLLTTTRSTTAITTSKPRWLHLPPYGPHQRTALLLLLLPGLVLVASVQKAEYVEVCQE
jgi:hypothetical protein